MGAISFGHTIVLGPLVSVLAQFTMVSTLLLLSRRLLGLAFFLFGAGPILWTISSTTLRRTVTPHAMLSRVSAIFVTGGWGVRPLGAALGGLVGATWGEPACLVLAMAGFVLQAWWSGPRRCAGCRCCPRRWSESGNRPAALACSLSCRRRHARHGESHGPICRISSALSPTRVQPDPIQRRRRDNEQFVTLDSAKCQVTDSLRHGNAAQQVALRQQHLHRIFAAGVDPALSVNTQAVGQARRYVGHQAHTRKCCSVDVERHYAVVPAAIGA